MANLAEAERGIDNPSFFFVADGAAISSIIWIAMR
jgi:hypothetical protein